MVTVEPTKIAPSKLRPCAAFLLVLSMAFLGSGCSWFRVKSIKQVSRLALPLPAKTATQSELIERLNRIAQSTKTLSLTVMFELTATSGRPDQIESYRETKGFILIKSPHLIRIIGQAFNINVFDMASDGKETSIFVPSKNKFYHLFNDQKIEKTKLPVGNLRPQDMLNALALEAFPQDSPDQPVVLEEDQEGRQRFYILNLVKRDAVGKVSLERKVWFDRFDLNIVRQKFFGNQGQLESDINYYGYKEAGGVPYPGEVVFRRPIEDYSLRIKVNKVKMNDVLTEDKFVLDRPKDAEFVDLSEPSRTAVPSHPAS